MSIADPVAGTGLGFTELANGICVVSDPMSTVESVSLGAWFGVGARNEAPQVNGVAHFLEHMAFKGTKRRGPSDIAEEIEAVGGHLNAYTSREQTAYYAKVLKNDVGLAVDILGDILQNSTFEEAELARERTVILQEIGQAADTPDDIIFDLFQEVAYPDQALGRPVLGRAEVVSEMSRDAIVDFIGANYGGDRMIFAAAGNVDHDALVASVEAGFGGLPKRQPAAVEPARYAGGELREERDLEQVHLILGFPAVNFHDPDFHAQQVLSMLLGGGMSSRLFQEIREKRGLVYSIYSFTSAYHDDGLLGIYAGTGEDQVAELVPVVCEELAKLADADLEAEVIRSRTQMKSGLLMSRETTSNRCEQIAQHMLVYGRVKPVDEIVAKVDAVDADAVRRVARRLLEGKPTLTALGPLSKLESYDAICGRLK
ncbi:MAG: pitrilysin family protein [Proteobacteria bacterium]|nr:pitrilysin family protein [Pseudomonadota bacterium]